MKMVCYLGFLICILAFAHQGLSQSDSCKASENVGGAIGAGIGAGIGGAACSKGGSAASNACAGAGGYVGGEIGKAVGRGLCESSRGGGERERNENAGKPSYHEGMSKSDKTITRKEIALEKIHEGSKKKCSLGQSTVSGWTSKRGEE